MGPQQEIRRAQQARPAGAAARGGGRAEHLFAGSSKRAARALRVDGLKRLHRLACRLGGAVKRGLDLVAAALLLLLLSPLFLIVAALIKATDGGPVLFWQTRVGRRGVLFPFPKFRSMVTNAERLKEQLTHQNQHGACITFKMKRDPRVTWIGRLMRRTSIDELPQLWCVLIGHMSLVGPRPPIPAEVAQYTLRDRGRLEAAPGLTCIWQVRGRADIPFPEQVQLDCEYIDRQSLWLDLKLLLQTVPAVLTGRGAY